MKTHVIETALRRQPRRSSARSPGPVRRLAFLLSDPPSERSLTALALDAVRAGVVASTRTMKPPSIPHDAEILCGDPDDTQLANEYVGDETPGGSASTPDQNDIDEIGRVYGVQEEDSGELRTSSELMSGRDRRRAELLAH
jgi:uncharacterized protein DUF6335